MITRLLLFILFCLFQRIVQGNPISITDTKACIEYCTSYSNNATAKFEDGHCKCQSTDSSKDLEHLSLTEKDLDELTLSSTSDLTNAERSARCLISLRRRLGLGRSREDPLEGLPSSIFHSHSLFRHGRPHANILLAVSPLPAIHHPLLLPYDNTEARSSSTDSCQDSPSFSRSNDVTNARNSQNDNDGTYTRPRESEGIVAHAVEPHYLLYPHIPLLVHRYSVLQRPLYGIATVPRVLIPSTGTRIQGESTAGTARSSGAERKPETDPCDAEQKVTKDEKN